MTDLTASDLVQLLIFGSLGLSLSAAVVRLFRGRLLTATLTLLFWVAAFGAALTGYSYRETLSGVAERVIATVVPGLPISSAPGEVTILRGLDGQFLVRARSGAAHLTLVFDTGASSVVLRAEDAAKVGIDTRHLVYDVMVGTANGRAMAADTVLPVLSIGSVSETRVPVLVARPGALHESLLGMTFLNRLAGYAVAANTLVLRGR